MENVVSEHTCCDLLVVGGGINGVGIARYARAYGTRVEMLLGSATSLEDLGEHLGDDVYGAELRYLVTQEWARTEEDVLWRRSKLGLHITEDTAQAIAHWLTQNRDNHLANNPG